eukprot:scaffold127388_cov30-Attheya_sp.AAC.2
MVNTTFSFFKSSRILMIFLAIAEHTVWWSLKLRSHLWSVVYLVDHLGPLFKINRLQAVDQVCNEIGPKGLYYGSQMTAAEDESLWLLTLYPIQSRRCQHKDF